MNKKSGKITVYDVANACGVSVATVSSEFLKQLVSVFTQIESQMEFPIIQQVRLEFQSDLFLHHEIEAICVNFIQLILL